MTMKCRLTTRAVSPSEALTPRLSDRAAWPKLLVSVAGFEGSAIKEDSRYLLQGVRRELIACLIRLLAVRMASNRRSMGSPFTVLALEEFQAV